jgi:hypothetical protein
MARGGHRGNAAGDDGWTNILSPDVKKLAKAHTVVNKNMSYADAVSKAKADLGKDGKGKGGGKGGKGGGSDSGKGKGKGKQGDAKAGGGQAKQQRSYIVCLSCENWEYTNGMGVSHVVCSDSKCGKRKGCGLLLDPTQLSVGSRPFWQYEAERHKREGKPVPFPDPKDEEEEESWDWERSMDVDINGGEGAGPYPSYSARRPRRENRATQGQNHQLRSVV